MFSLGNVDQNEIVGFAAMAQKCNFGFSTLSFD